MAHYPSPKELEAIFDERDAALVRLAQKEAIQGSDLDGLDRLGRFCVVDKLWEKCEVSARTRLANDPHPHVRSAVAIAERQHHTLPGERIVQLMRKHRMTIRSLAKRMNITMKRVREVRRTGVSGRCMCLDWNEAITGSGIYAQELL